MDLQFGSCLPGRPALSWFTMDTFLRHPLVIVVVIAAIAIGFYYFASPYENCVRQITNPGNVWLEKCRSSSNFIDLRLAVRVVLSQADRSTGHLRHVQKRHWLLSDRVCRRLGHGNILLKGLMTFTPPRLCDVQLVTMPHPLGCRIFETTHIFELERLSRVSSRSADCG